MAYKLTLASDSGAVSLIEVSPDSLISTLALMVQAELSIEPAEQDLRFNGRQLSPSATVSASGLSDGDLIMVSRKQQAARARADAPARAGASNATADAALVESLLGNERIMEALRTSNPSIYEAIRARDPEALEAFRGFVNEHISGQNMPGGSAGPQQEMVDPMTADGQKAIEERIRMENVVRNMEAAMEHNPESFGSVIMLFVDCKVNSVAGVKAFVDSGAQTTIISKQCAERCNILRLLDTRFAGVAHGVGSATIYGRIHLALLTLGSEVFEVSFKVMDAVGGSYDMLLGLDMLRKHQATIDLRDDCLRIGSTRVPFLAEKDIPRNMLSAGPEEEEEAGAEKKASTSSGPTAPTSQSSTPAPAPSAAAAGGASVGGSNAAVSQLVELGFSATEAEEALRQCNGNADQAAAMLTSQKYGF